MRPELTDAQVQTGARPGESWDAARRRLTEQRDRLATWPRQVYPCSCWDSRYPRWGWIVDGPTPSVLNWCDGCHDMDATFEEPEAVIY